MREFALIDRLGVRLAARRPDTRLGIGDDAALIAPAPGQELAITTDTLIAGRHFPHDTPAFDIGYKAVAVNLSDLAAMGAEPAWLTLALSAPALERDWCDDFIDGALAAIEPARVDIIGGDTTRGALSITFTAIGRLPAGAALRRDRARPGDMIAVTGSLGDAAYGLQCWPERAQASADQHWCIARLTRPQWRAGAALRGLAHAAIDISDGLGADLDHVLVASGVGATLDLDTLPASPALARETGITQRRMLQWGGGDDYELCITLDPADLAPAQRALGCVLTPIGHVDAEPGLRLVDADGYSQAVPGTPGWDHFEP